MNEQRPGYKSQKGSECSSRVHKWWLLWSERYTSRRTFRNLCATALRKRRAAEHRRCCMQAAARPQQMLQRIDVRSRIARGPVANLSWQPAVEAMTDRPQLL